MKAGSRPQYYRIRRMVQMEREGAETGYLPNSSDFMAEFGASRLLLYWLFHPLYLVLSILLSGDKNPFSLSVFIFCKNDKTPLPVRTGFAVLSAGLTLIRPNGSKSAYCLF